MKKFIMQINLGMFILLLLLGCKSEDGSSCSTHEYYIAAESSQISFVGIKSDTVVFDTILEHGNMLHLFSTFPMLCGNDISEDVPTLKCDKIIFKVNDLIDTSYSYSFIADSLELEDSQLLSAAGIYESTNYQQINVEGDIYTYLYMY